MDASVQTVHNLMFVLFSASCSSVLLTLAVIHFAVYIVMLNELVASIKKCNKKITQALKIGEWEKYQITDFTGLNTFSIGLPPVRLIVVSHLKTKTFTNLE